MGWEKTRGHEPCVLGAKWMILGTLIFSNVPVSSPLPLHLTKDPSPRINPKGTESYSIWLEPGAGWGAGGRNEAFSVVSASACPPPPTAILQMY